MYVRLSDNNLLLTATVTCRYMSGDPIVTTGASEEFAPVSLLLL